MKAKQALAATVGVVCALSVFHLGASPGEGKTASSAAKGFSVTATQPDKAIQVRVNGAYGNLPLHFEKNQGQTDEKVKFLSRGSGYTLFLTATEAVLALRKPGEDEVKTAGERPELVLERPDKQATKTTVLRMRLVGANPSPEVVGLEELPGTANYFVGNDPEKWQRNVSTYAKVKYENVYPGIDLVYYGNQGQLEHDFTVRPNAEPAALRLVFEGAEEIKLDGKGNLVLSAGQGEVVLKAPIVYQEVDGARRNISGGYVLEEDNQVGFRVAAYDRTRPLVIDPVLVYSTYLGGWDARDAGYGIAVDGSGNAYMTGKTESVYFPTANPLQAANAGGLDAFVTKINAAGSALVYSTYLGGSGWEVGEDIAVDGAGSAYVAGWTASTDFPTASPIQGASAGYHDAFVAKLNTTGSALVYSTYVGGSDSDYAYGIALDGSSDALITGVTHSADFPTANPIQGAFAGFRDAFVTKINPAGSALLYSTYLGGGGDDRGYDVAVHSVSGDAYVTGFTDSTDFPTANPIQGAKAGLTDLFVTRLEAAGSSLIFSTYLGGSDGWDVGNGIAVDTDGNACVTGYTASTDFPTANPVQALHGGGQLDAFVTKLNGAGSVLLFSTYLGGGMDDNGLGIALDGSANIHVTGETLSTDFPTQNPTQPANEGGSYDVFLTKIDSSTAALLFSTYLGGFLSDHGYAIAVDGSENAYLTGETFGLFPMVNPIQGGESLYTDAFVAKIQTLCQIDSDCDDSDECTLDVCNPNNPAADSFGCLYTTVDCDDGNLCTDDACLPPTGCEYTNNTAPCDDADVCTTNDMCGNGVCGGTEALGCLDHFLCYKTNARQEIPDVTLSDQFDANAVHQVKTGKLFCVPADKKGEGIVDEDTHLMVYKVRGPHVPRANIEVANQFGTLFFDTKKAYTLMVPTAKSLAPGPFPGLPDPGSLVDHYRCLRVRTTKGTEKLPKELRQTPLAVDDQFGSRSVFLRKPSKLCLPVDKDGEGIKNPDAHLLCYKVKTDPRTSVTGVQVNNQFGPATIDLKKEAELCVPSVKVVPTTSTTTTSTSTTTTVP